MLHNEAGLPGTLALLKELIALNELSNFALVGGTPWHYAMDTGTLKI